MTHRATWVIAVVSLFALLAAIPAAAQSNPGHPVVLTNPNVNAPIKFDISRPLRDMATEAPSQIGMHEASPVKYPHLQQLMQAAQSPQARDGALQITGGPHVSATLGLNLLGVGNGFPGYTVPDAPPDVNLAVGDTQVVQWVNVSYAVFDKNTGAIIQGPTLGNAFWSGFGGGCEFTNSGDILAQWDKVAHRWVMSQNIFSSPYGTCIAISTSPDATGTYYRYHFSQPGFPDYPKIGIWPDAYYQSQNNFGSAGNSFQGAYVCAYDRNKMLVGDPSAAQICFQLGSFDNSLLPADLDSVNTPPPAGEKEVFVGSVDESSSNVFEYLFHADFTTPSNSTLTGANGSMPVAVASYSLACGGVGCIPQKGITDMLDSLGDRLMYRLAYRNFGDHQTWLVSHSVSAGSSTGIRWYEFHAPETSTGLSVYQQGTFAPDSNYRWMSSLAMDQAQDIALGYTVSSSSLYPSISYTGRVATDTLGTMESEASIISGSGSQPDTANRWGDYWSMAIDAADDCTFWFTAEYYQLTQTFDWSTRLASIKFPNCGPQQPDFSISAAPSAVTVVQGNQGSSTITTTALNGFNDSITLSASGMPTGVGVSFSPNPIAAPGTGTSSMTIAVASNTSPGTYPITVTGTSTSNQHSTTVMLTVTGPATFSISASPSSLTIAEGNQSSTTVTTTAMNGFNSSIALSASGMPTGVTVGFNPTSISAPGSGHSTMTVTVSSTAPPGTYPITVTGNGGGVQQSTTVTLTVTQGPTFTITANPSSVSIAQGYQSSTTITTSALNGFNSQISLSASGVPSGVNVNLQPNNIHAPGSGTSTMTIQVNSNTPAGSYPITVTGSGGNQQHSTTVTLTVTVPSFTMSASPNSLTIAAGGRGTSTITTTVSGGFNSSISFQGNNLPGGVNVSFNPNQIPAPGSGSSTMTVTVNSNTTPGNYSFTVTGKGGNLQRSTTLTLTVTPAPNYTISATPSTETVTRGSPATYTVTLTPVGGFNSSVSLSLNGCPSHATCSFNPGSLTPPGNSTLTVATTSQTNTGNYNLTITGNGGGQQHSVTVQLTVH